MKKNKFLLIMLLVLTSIIVIQGAAGAVCAPLCDYSNCLGDSNCGSDQYCGDKVCFTEIEPGACFPEEESGCLPCISTEGAGCTRAAMCCSNICSLGHCCPTFRPYWWSSDSSCHESYATHRACVSGQCKSVAGSGTDQCSGDAGCYHYECGGVDDKECLKVNAYPDVANTCEDSTDCGAACIKDDCNYDTRKICLSSLTWSNADANAYCNGCNNHCGDGECNCNEDIDSCRADCCVDEDNDGWCKNGVNGVGDDQDCDDTTPFVSPDDGEICWGSIDEDCDGLVDCADQGNCYDKGACKECTSVDDCPPNPCFSKITCEDYWGGDGYKECRYQNKICVKDGYCCFPVCTYAEEPDDCKPCPKYNPGNNSLHYLPVNTDAAGSLGVYIQNNGNVVYLGRSHNNFVAAMDNALSTRNCNYPTFSRAFAVIDTSCIPKDAKIIGNVEFVFKIDAVRSHQSGMDWEASVWVEHSNKDLNDDTWIIPEPYVNNPSDSTQLAVFNKTTIWGINRVPVPKQYLNLENYTRFYLRFGTKDWRSDQWVAQKLDNCVSPKFSCGAAANCQCRADVNYNCPGDPCLIVSNLRTFITLAGVDTGLCVGCMKGDYPAKDKTHGCRDDAEMSGPIEVTTSWPILNISFCAPNCDPACGQPDGCGDACSSDNLSDGYVNECDASDICLDASIAAGLGSMFGIERNNPPFNMCNLTVDISCRTETLCFDGFDNDCDGDIDCADSDCGGVPENCTNGIDDDCDGFIDCDDPSCGCPWCPKDENCTNSLDDDCDGLIDCFDVLNCSGCPDCPAAAENCTNGIDDDCDGAIDGIDNNECPEGSGNETASIYRYCDDGASNDAWNDTFGLMADQDDDGCCDLCIGPSPVYPGELMVFDTILLSGCAVPGCSCSGLQFTDWDNSSGTDMFCCGDDPSEVYRSTTMNTAPTFVCNASAQPYPCPYHACCNETTHCIDGNGYCQIGVENTIDLCIDGLDNDCDGLIDIYDDNCSGTVWGYVFDKSNIPQANALVKGSPLGPAAIFESMNTTNILGRYIIQNAFIGSYNFIARKIGFDDNVTALTINPGSTQQVNFTLRNGSCHADCTDYYDNCNYDCEGLEFGAGEDCTFITTLCDGKPKDFKVRYFNITTGLNHEYTCCEGPERSYPRIRATVTGSAKDVYDMVITIKGPGGEIEIVHLLVWIPG